MYIHLLLLYPILYFLYPLVVPSIVKVESVLNIFLWICIIIMNINSVMSWWTVGCLVIDNCVYPS